ncbi:MAG: sugar phosphate isomerase/epimerase [Chryseobacterium sp.]|nr:sugar phosphate isomerase/epimerase [Candidatus Chryseobacterium enterohippi]
MGLQLYTIREVLLENPEKALEKVAQLGFKKIELFGYNGTFYGISKKEFSNILMNTGLTVISSHHNTGIISPEMGTFAHHWEKTLEDLSFVGCEYAVCSYLLPEERTNFHYERLPDYLNAIGEQSKQCNIQLAYHNHDFEFERNKENIPFYDFILKNTSADLVKMEIDLYWIAKAGYNVLEYFDEHPNRFPLWHVKDMNKLTKHFTEIGSGEIDFKTIFEAKNKVGLLHYFVEQDECFGDSFESLSISKNYIDQHSFFNM